MRGRTSAPFACGDHSTLIRLSSTSMSCSSIFGGGRFRPFLRFGFRRLFVSSSSCGDNGGGDGELRTIGIEMVGGMMR